jgi:hypothetical protein
VLGLSHGLVGGLYKIAYMIQGLLRRLGFCEDVLSEGRLFE